MIDITIPYCSHLDTISTGERPLDRRSHDYDIVNKQNEKEN